MTRDDDAVIHLPDEGASSLGANPRPQGLVRAFELEPCAVFGGGGLFLPKTVLALVSGSACIHMCASTITASGLGNGSSLVICSSIITGEEQGTCRTRARDKRQGPCEYCRTRIISPYQEAAARTDGTRGHGNVGGAGCGCDRGLPPTRLPGSPPREA